MSEKQKVRRESSSHSLWELIFGLLSFLLSFIIIPFLNLNPLGLLSLVIMDMLSSTWHVFVCVKIGLMPFREHRTQTKFFGF